jgi:hypothetical protein
MKARSSRIASFREARHVLDRRGLPDESRDDAPAVAELGLDRMKAAVRNHSREATHHVENGIRAVQCESSVVVLDVDVVGHQLAQRLEVFRVVSSDPAVRDVDGIRFEGPPATTEELMERA